MDWNTLPLLARIAVCYLAGCAFLSACFGIEWAMYAARWLADRYRWMRWFSL